VRSVAGVRGCSGAVYHLVLFFSLSAGCARAGRLLRHLHYLGRVASPPAAQRAETDASMHDGQMRGNTSHDSAYLLGARRLAIPLDATSVAKGGSPLRDRGAQNTSLDFLRLPNRRPDVATIESLLEGSNLVYKNVLVGVLS
jgi:hypothetical protein